jgi:hypothetical protein
VIFKIFKTFKNQIMDKVQNIISSNVRPSPKTLEKNNNNTRENIMKFEVITAVKMMIWVVMSCGPVGTYQHFGGVYCLPVANPGLEVRPCGNAILLNPPHIQSHHSANVF